MEDEAKLAPRPKETFLRAADNRDMNEMERLYLAEIEVLRARLAELEREMYDEEETET